MHNHITIHGYLGRDPELKEYRNAQGEDRKLCNLSVGVSRINEGTDWFDVTFFGKRAEVVDKFFQKGSQIIVSGRMQSDTVKGDDGKNRKYWKLIGSSFDFCDSKDSPRGSSNSAVTETDSFKAAEDDIPF